MTKVGWTARWVDSRWEARFSAFVQTGPGAKLASYTVGTGSFQGQSGPGVALTHTFNLAPSINESRAIPLLPIWAFMSSCIVNFRNFVFSVPCISNQLPQCKLTSAHNSPD